MKENQDIISFDNAEAFIQYFGNQQQNGIYIYTGEHSEMLACVHKVKGEAIIIENTNDIKEYLIKIMVRYSKNSNNVINAEARADFLENYFNFGNGIFIYTEKKHTIGGLVHRNKHGVAILEDNIAEYLNPVINLEADEICTLPQISSCTEFEEYYFRHGPGMYIYIGNNNTIQSLVHRSIYGVCILEEKDDVDNYILPLLQPNFYNSSLSCSSSNQRDDFLEYYANHGPGIYVYMGQENVIQGFVYVDNNYKQTKVTENPTLELAKLLGFIDNSVYEN